MTSIKAYSHKDLRLHTLGNVLLVCLWYSPLLQKYALRLQPYGFQEQSLILDIWCDLLLN